MKSKTRTTLILIALSVAGATGIITFIVSKQYSVTLKSKSWIFSTRRKYSDALQERASSDEFCRYTSSRVVSGLARALPDAQVISSSCRAESPFADSTYLQAFLDFDFNRPIGHDDYIRLKGVFGELGYGALRSYVQNGAYFLDLEGEIILGVGGQFGQNEMKVMAQRRANF